MEERLLEKEIEGGTRLKNLSEKGIIEGRTARQVSGGFFKRSFINAIPRLVEIRIFSLSESTVRDAITDTDCSAGEATTVEEGGNEEKEGFDLRSNFFAAW